MIENIEQLELHTKLSFAQRKSLILWFSRQNLDFQVIIFQEQKNQFFKLKNENFDKDLLSIASFLIAIQNFYNKERLVKSKNKTQSLSDLETVTKLEIIKFRKEKQKHKLQMLLSLHSVIANLHQNKFSLRDIQKYLRTKHRKNVSHTYLSNYIKNYILSEQKDV